MVSDDHERHHNVRRERVLIEVANGIRTERTDDTMIIPATRAAVDMRASQSPKKIIMISGTTPAISVGKRVRPPEFTFIID